MRTRIFVACGAGLAAVALSGSIARAESPRFGPHDVSSLFTISKSENKNEVVYAVHLDEHCAPVGDAPIVAFWRMHEKGTAVIEPLLSREEQAYGIARQKVTSAGANGGTVELTLRALPKRPIVVRTQQLGAVCHGWSTIAIEGVDAYLYNVYAKVGTFSVDYLLLSGWTIDGSRVVHEQVKP